jgi:CBS domain-containing protein
MLLKEICTPEVVCCSPETTVLAAARLMRQRHVGDLVVVDDPEGDQPPLGMITDRDLVVEVLARERDPAAITVREIMRAPVAIASSSEDAAQAVERMRTHGVRRIPVIGNDGKLAGIVSLDDLLTRLAADASLLAEVVAREQGREHRTRR